MTERRKPYSIARRAVIAVAITVLLALAAAFLLWPLTPPGWGRRRHHGRTDTPDAVIPEAEVSSNTDFSIPTNFQLPVLIHGTNAEAVRLHDDAAAAILEKRKQDLARIQNDSVALDTVNAGLGRLAQIKALPPWIPSRIGPGDVRKATYSDHPPLGCNIRMATDYIPNMRLDRFLTGGTTLMVLEVRYDPDGLPINAASVSNSAYRSGFSPPIGGAKDAFQERASQIFQSMGYDMSGFETCPKAGWNYDAQIGTNFVAIRSFQRKGGLRVSNPDLSINLCSPTGAATGAYVTGYFVFTSPAPWVRGP